MITPDLLAPGNYFWRVRALHGEVRRALVGRACHHRDRCARHAGGLRFLRDHHRTRKRLWRQLEPRASHVNQPAPAGGALVTLASDIPQAEVPSRTVTIPAGKTT